MSAAVNIRPLVPAAMMTGSTILVKVLMVVLLFAAGCPAKLNTAVPYSHVHLSMLVLCCKCEKMEHSCSSRNYSPLGSRPGLRWTARARMLIRPA